MQQYQSKSIFFIAFIAFIATRVASLEIRSVHLADGCTDEPVSITYSYYNQLNICGKMTDLPACKKTSDGLFLKYECRNSTTQEENASATMPGVWAVQGVYDANAVTNSSSNSTDPSICSNNNLRSITATAMNKCLKQSNSTFLKFECDITGIREFICTDTECGQCRPKNVKNLGCFATENFQCALNGYAFPDFSKTRGLTGSDVANTANTIALSVGAFIISLIML